MAGRWIWLYLCQSVVLGFLDSSARLGRTCRHYNSQPIVEARVRVGHVLILIYSDAPTMLRQSPRPSCTAVKKCNEMAAEGRLAIITFDNSDMCCCWVSFIFEQDTHSVRQYIKDIGVGRDIQGSSISITPPNLPENGFMKTLVALGNNSKPGSIVCVSMWQVLFHAVIVTSRRILIEFTTHIHKCSSAH